VVVQTAAADAADAAKLNALRHAAAVRVIDESNATVTAARDAAGRDAATIAALRQQVIAVKF
jgi:hypothetical protein